MENGANTAGLLQEAWVEAIIVRADGRREALGVVAYYHRNPLRRALFRLRRDWQRLRRGGAVRDGDRTDR